MKKRWTICLAIALSQSFLAAQNPIISNRGVNDPHIKIYENKAYLYATHDRALTNKGFVMDDWWVWSSKDLVNWKLECVLKPEDTYIGKPYNQCWATDAAFRNGRYYWYFSEKNQQAGVVESALPAGPWTDPLKKPLLSADLTPTHEYDIAVFRDTDEQFYIVFGVWNYYIARLNEDMISLAETPREIKINNPAGPYGQGKTDDKPFLHKYNGKYYLSWGCFYAMSDNVYGPYNYVGAVMNKDSFANGYDQPTWPNGPLQGRHGSFFEWNNQWYFAYCDMSRSSSRYFRDTFISYIHYKDNGQIAPVRVDGIGAGEYDARGRIEAEDYFKAEGIKKAEWDGGFIITAQKSGAFVIYPNIRGLEKNMSVAFRAVLPENEKVEIVIHKESPQGDILEKCFLAGKQQSGRQGEYSFTLNGLTPVETLCFVFQSDSDFNMRLDSFCFGKIQGTSGQN